MRKILAYIIILSSIFLLNGCEGSKSAAGQSPEDEAVQMIHFELGESSFDENGTTIPFPLDGVLGVPEGEANPIVFILHGAHPIEDVTQDRYYEGFSYLAEYLAQQGYLTVAINLNRAYSFEPVEGEESVRAFRIFQAYYTLVERAIKGEQVFSADLTGKGQLDKLNFIGHSRGGDNSLVIAKELTQNDSGVVQSVMLVAAAMQTGYQALYIDLPTAVVLPQFDGDVVGLDANAIFQNAYWSGQARKSPAAAAFLYGGDHSQFNAQLTNGDQLAPPPSATYISAEKQRDFLCKYATDFLNLVNHDSSDFAVVLGNDAPKKYEIDFMPSVLVPGRATLLAPDIEKTNVTEMGMQAEYVESSENFREDTAAPLRLPYGFDKNISLYRLRWTESGAKISIATQNGDWSNSRYLSLFLANDASAKGNTGETPVKLRVTLIDDSGASADYVLSGDHDTALQYIRTPVENVFEGMDNFPVYLQATEFTPLSTQILPLSLFDGINQQKVRSIELTGESEFGALVLQGIDLYK